MSTPPERPLASGPQDPTARRADLDDAPPLLGSWRNIYLVVLGTLAVLVALFWALTKAYA